MLQVAVPTCLRNRILVSFQTLTLDASKMAVRNRKERSEARAKAASARRAARQAREGKKKVQCFGASGAQRFTGSFTGTFTGTFTG